MNFSAVYVCAVAAAVAAAHALPDTPRHPGTLSAYQPRRGRDLHHEDQGRLAAAASTAPSTALDNQAGALALGGERLPHGRALRQSFLEGIFDEGDEGDDDDDDDDGGGDEEDAEAPAAPAPAEDAATPAPAPSDAEEDSDAPAPVPAPAPAAAAAAVVPDDAELAALTPPYTAQVREIFANDTFAIFATQFP